MSASETQSRPPDGLSRVSRRLWRELTDRHRFEPHELVAFERALGWWDKSDAWLLASEAAEGREQAQLVKQSLDAAQTALRYWRTLKFTDPSVPKRRPGRPAGDDWSPERRAMKAAG